MTEPRVKEYKVVYDRIKKVKPIGGGAYVTVPKMLIGRNVRITIELVSDATTAAAEQRKRV